MGLTTDGKRVPREGYGIFHDNNEVGSICSGAISPTLDTYIGHELSPHRDREGRDPYRNGYPRQAPSLCGDRPPLLLPQQEVNQTYAP